MAVQAPHWRFTVDDLLRMAEAGVLGEDDRVELIRGELIEMAAIGARHAGCVNRFARALQRRVGDSAIVSVQNPVWLGRHDQPQPDLAVLRPREDYYSRHHPAVPDILLLVEVADTSGPYDRDVKLPLYARAGVPETWLADLPGAGLERHSDPGPEGYRSVERVGPGGKLASVALPPLVLDADEVLGPPEFGV